MRLIKLILIAFVLSSIIGACEKSEPVTKDTFSSINCPGCFFNTKKDTEEWTAINCQAIYDKTDGTFSIFADKFDTSLSGNQVSIVFSYPEIKTGKISAFIGAGYNFIVGGDSGAMPYELDESYSDNFVEITSIDEEQQVIEGHFSIRLKRKSFYDNTEYKEHVFLNRGSFKLHYEIYDFDM